MDRQPSPIKISTSTVSLLVPLGSLVIAILLLAPTSVWAQWRTIDGSNNNETNVETAEWGAAGMPLTRKAAADYPGDGSGSTIIEAPARANPRDISNAVSTHQSGPLMNDRGLSSGLWQWGQFLDHDIDLTDSDSANGTAPIPVQAGDILGPSPIPFNRSNFAAGTGTPSVPRQQINEITSYIDASNVYGSDATRAAALRTMSGGKLKTSAGNLLPFNTAGLPNAGARDRICSWPAISERTNKPV